MALTPILGITELASNQNQKEITINNMIVALEAAGNAVLGFTFTANARTLSASDYTRYVGFMASNQTAAATLTVPLTKRVFLMYNGNATHDIIVGGATGTIVTVPAQSMLLILCDGTDCRTLAVDATGAVTSVLGEVGVVTLPDLVAGGLAPADDPTFTGTVDVSGADSVLVPDPTVDGEAASKGYVDGKTWGYAALPADVQAVPIPFAFSGLPLAGQVIHIPLVIDLTIPANFAGALGYAATPATADAAFVLDYIRAGTPTTIGTITMATGSSAATLSTQAAVDLSSGDILRLTAPSPQDATLANASLTLLALRT